MPERFRPLEAIKEFADQMGWTAEGRARIYQAKMDAAKAYLEGETIEKVKNNPLYCPTDDLYLPSVQSKIDRGYAEHFDISPDDYSDLKRKARNTANEMHLEFLKTYTGNVTCRHRKYEPQEAAVFAKANGVRMENRKKRDARRSRSVIPGLGGHRSRRRR